MQSPNSVQLRNAAFIFLPVISLIAAIKFVPPIFRKLTASHTGGEEEEEEGEDAVKDKREENVENQEADNGREVVQTTCVGIKNDAATCYLNSLLQMLFHIPIFRKAVFKMKSNNKLSIALQRVFYDLQFNDGESISTEKLTKSFGWSHADRFEQHDIQELVRKLIDVIEQRMKQSSMENLMEKLFAGEMESIISCIHVPYQSSRTEMFYDLQLDVSASLNTSFSQYIVPNFLTGDNQYDSGKKYGKQDAKKYVLFKQFPPILMLHLKRFEFNPITYGQKKISRVMQFQDEIDLNPYILGGPEQNQQDNIYTLHGVLVHQGTVDSGHYFAYINTAEWDKNIDGDNNNFMAKKKWTLFNDEKVTPVSEFHAIQQNFGGIQTAYMLIYIRKSGAKRLLSSLHMKDIPKRVRDRFEKERQNADSSNCVAF